MYTANMLHFLDDEGNIAKEMTKEGRELSSYLALIIDAYTSLYTDDRQVVRCFNENCLGIIAINRSILSDNILWFCPECHLDGEITDWRGTVWDNKNTFRLEGPENEKKILYWIDKLKSGLSFPISATASDIFNDINIADIEMKIVGVHDYVEIYGLIVVAMFGEDEKLIPLCELHLKDEESANYKLVEEFLEWWSFHQEEDN